MMFGALAANAKQWINMDWAFIYSIVDKSSSHKFCSFSIALCDDLFDLILDCSWIGAALHRAVCLRPDGPAFVRIGSGRLLHSVLRILHRSDLGY